MTKKDVLEVAARQLGWETCAKVKPENLEDCYADGMTPQEVVDFWWRRYSDHRKAADEKYGDLHNQLIFDRENEISLSKNGYVTPNFESQPKHQI